ncbi:MAG: protein-tyrosine phosphatase family protein [Anaerolineae bacterium]
MSAESKASSGAESPEVGGIANFGWVAPGRLARGEQPYESLGGYAALRRVGVTSVISLREASERENTVAGLPVPPYDVREEAEACRAHGLRFRHVAFIDRSVLPVDGLVAALAAIDEELAAGKVVFIHCMAGIGRTGILAALWLLAHGASGDEAVAHFLSYWREFGLREDAVLGPLPDTVLDRYGFPLQWWTMQRLAEYFGTPIAGEYEGARAQEPEGARAWLTESARQLAPWRAARKHG